MVSSSLASFVQLVFEMNRPRSKENTCDDMHSGGTDITQILSEWYEANTGCPFIPYELVFAMSVFCFQLR